MSLSILKEVLQALYALSLRAAQIDLITGHRREDQHFTASATDGYIEATLTPCLIQRAKVHTDLPRSICTIADREEDDITLITLHILKVLDEDRLIELVGQLL